ncbi:MAG: ACP S-malonyltransferase [Solirubrobacteraceae bacterium MAG38_C4-C5]|nr:ACP S-malonyltransferase [Candidatus Siliceabacter maunaloa]
MASDVPTAILFPGQGSQQPDMRDMVAEREPALLERCVELVGEDPFPRAGESTRFAQPAIFLASVAGWRRAAGLLDAPPVAMAGHSLGELAALVAAQAVDADHALELVVVRGREMAKVGTGTMLALLGPEPEEADALARDHGVHVANDNAPGQVVLSGDADALVEVSRVARERGHKAMELGVVGAFHSPAVEPAVAPFAQALEQVAFAAPAIPVISCATAQPMGDPRVELAAALTLPVHWRATMAALVELGARRFLDAGPGRVLDRLVKRTAPEAQHGTLAALEEGARA